MFTMKKIFYLLTLSLFCFSAKAQNRDNIWMLGTVTIFSPKPGIDFYGGFADTFSVIRPLAFFETDAGICDTDGNELFYTNGIWIENRNHDTLENSGKFNPGTFKDQDS